MSKQKIALILGATGDAGKATARALLRHGWHIRALHRNPASVASTLPEAEWVQGDAMNSADVIKAAAGATLIFHGVNPPGYKDWDKLVPPMLENSIAAAKHSGARLVLPGNVYNFDPDAVPMPKETSPQRPISKKGRVRVQMEDRLRKASAEEGVKALILRAGDFFGPGTGNSWLSQAIIKPGKKDQFLTYPGNRDAGHTWTYLPDFAETVVRLIDQEDRLDTFESFHFGGHWFERGVEIAERARVVAGEPSAPIRSFPWIVIRLLSPVVRLFRELSEMRYLWSKPLRLDNSKLLAFLGAEPHTEIDTALKQTLKQLKCI